MKKIKIGSYFVFFIQKENLKSIRLRFDKNKNIILSAPLFCSEQQAVSFAKQHLNWIAKQIDTFKTIRFKNNDTISILGQNYIIEHNPLHKKGTIIQDNHIVVGGESTFLHRRITTFAKEQFYQYAQAKALQMAVQLDTPIQKITLKNSSSRWGSCSSLKNINLCWKLVFAPLDVIDYVIAHEVAHLIEMNHSPKFWAVVSQLNVKQADAQIWLRKNGKTIQSIE
ncbi:MAG: DUF45 domain-containing protein [Alphaproteobacteria bacterium]|nr:DUF45 domain-containing protein [Alphaproteobacteria bacterium]